VTRRQRRRLEQHVRRLRDLNDELALRLVHMKVMSVEKWDDYQLAQHLGIWQLSLARHFGSVEVAPSDGTPQKGN
jgi:hypothetical protein